MYLHARMDTITMIAAVAMPCNAPTAIELTPHALNIVATKYRIATTHISQNDTLFRLTVPEDLLVVDLLLDDVDFVLDALFFSAMLVLLMHTILFSYYAYAALIDEIESICRFFNSNTINAKLQLDILFLIKLSNIYLQICAQLLC